MGVVLHDRVCHRALQPGTEAERVTYAGSTYLFCSEACARTFARDPERYVSSIDGVKPTGRIPIAEAEREHRPYAGPTAGAPDEHEP